MLLTLNRAVATALLLHLHVALGNDINSFQNGLLVLNQTGGQGNQEQGQNQQNQGQQGQSQPTQSQQNAAAATSQAAGQCFLPNGSQDPNSIPCFSDDTSSTCCGTNEFCSDNKLCVSKSDSSKITRGSCVDQTFQADGCPNFCAGVNNAGTVAVLQCGDLSLGQFCCGVGEGYGCCSNTTNILTLGEPKTFAAGASSSPRANNRKSTSTQSKQTTSQSQAQTPQAQEPKKSQSPSTSSTTPIQTQTVVQTSISTQVQTVTSKAPPPSTSVIVQTSVQVVTSQAPQQAQPPPSTSVILATSTQVITSVTQITSAVVASTPQPSANSQSTISFQQMSQSQNPSSAGGETSTSSIFQNQNSEALPQSAFTSADSQPTNPSRQTQPQPQISQQFSPNTGIIVAIVIVALVLIAALAASFYYFRIRAAKRSSRYFESSLGNINLMNPENEKRADSVHTIHNRLAELKEKVHPPREEFSPGAEMEISVPIVKRASMWSANRPYDGELRNEEEPMRDTTRRVDWEMRRSDDEEQMRDVTRDLTRRRDFF